MTHSYKIDSCPQCGEPRNAEIIKGTPFKRICAACANRNRRTSRNLIPNDRVFLEELYWNQKLSMNRIADIYHVGSSTVDAKLKELGIKTRSPREAQLLRGEQNSGVNNPNYKNGRTQNGKTGYVFILKPDHPRAHQGYVREHILVWEEAHGIPLPKGWVVHHINGIKNDNRPENLLGLPSRHHYRLIPELQKVIRMLESKLSCVEVKEIEEARYGSQA